MNLCLLLTIVLAASSIVTATEHQSHCPSNTTPLNGSSGESWCVRFYNDNMTFCDAVKTCHDNGEEMISRPVFDAMKASPLIDASSKWWVGLTDAAHERGTNKSGWVWMKDGQVTTEGEDYFAPNEPNNITWQDCVTSMPPFKRLADTKCNRNRVFFCYLNLAVPAAVVPQTNFTFNEAPIIEYDQPDSGCWIKSSNVPSVFDCTIACFTFGLDCVGFYWNSARQECVILPYFDAAVPLSFTDNEQKMLWCKFLRSN